MFRKKSNDIQGKFRIILSPTRRFENLITSCQSDKIVNFVNLTYNNWLTVVLPLSFIWYRIHKCNTNDRLDALCEEIRKERNISIDVTHGI